MPHPDPDSSLTRDLAELAWLQRSAALPVVADLVADALLEWAAHGGRYPGSGDAREPAGYHLQALAGIVDRLDALVGSAEPVPRRMRLGRLLRASRRALDAAADPGGVREAVGREALFVYGAHLPGRLRSAL